MNKKTAANSLALSFLKLYLIIPLINFYFQYLKFNNVFSTDRLCYIFFLFCLIRLFFFLILFVIVRDADISRENYAYCVAIFE